jgi:hypothetical protein
VVVVVVVVVVQLVAIKTSSSGNIGPTAAALSFVLAAQAAAMLSVRGGGV